MISKGRDKGGRPTHEADADPSQRRSDGAENKGVAECDSVSLTSRVSKMMRERGDNRRVLADFTDCLGRALARNSLRQFAGEEVLEDGARQSDSGDLTLQM